MPLREQYPLWYNTHMKTYICLLVATIGVKVLADDYKEATTQGLKSVDDIQHATTGALKYLGVRWELDCVQEEK